jgi:hypothetical protein
MAMESIDALETELTVRADLDDHRKLITESALLNNALVLYVRATKTESRERGSFDLRTRFGDQEMIVHKELSDLRDSAIAHFGSGGSYGGEWHAELAILQFSGADAKIGVVTRRQTVDRNLVRRAPQQIETALKLMRAVYYEKLAKITASIEVEAAADAKFSEEIHRHPLNLDLFMKSADAADAARGSFGGLRDGQREPPLAHASRSGGPGRVVGSGKRFATGFDETLVEGGMLEAQEDAAHPVEADSEFVSERLMRQRGREAVR